MIISQVTSVTCAIVTSSDLLVPPRGEPDMAEELLERPVRRVADVVEQAQTATFPRRVQVAPEARRFVTEAIGQHPAADDAVLLAGELIANSLLHAHDAATVTVAVAVSEMFIRIDVYDDGRTGIPHWRETDGGSESGRGFHLVNQIAERWGFVREQARTCCWAEVAAVPAPTLTEERKAP
jgi:anti-sigma regulatory factor (Ser/Thr protein kinase)